MDGKGTQVTRARGRHGRTRRRPKIGAVGGVIDTLSELGATSLAPYMAVLAGLSFVSGLAQAGLLVLISEVAVSIVQSNRPLRFHGLIIGRDEAILIAAMLVLIFGALSLVFAWLSSRLSGKALELSRQRVLGAFFGASWSLQSQERLGHLQQLVTVNCTRVGNILLAITSGVQSALTVLALLAAAFFVDPLAAAVVLAFGLLLSFALRPFGRWSRKASRELAEKTQTLGTLVTEYTRLVREFRLFGVERTAVSELLENNSDAAATFGRTKQLVQTGPVIYQSLALGFVVVALFVLTGTGVAKDLGSVGAVLLLILRCLTYGSNIQSISQQVRTYEAFLDVVKEDLRYYEAVPSVTGGEAMPQNLDVWFNGVSYAYDGVNLVLRDITFRLPGGSILGVVGRSGSGKTTLTQLLLGLRTPSNGSVLIGTVMVDELEKEGGKSPVGIVPQEPVLLQGSIAANIAFFRQIPRETIEMASRAAHLDADVRGMPLGYESRVGEGGGALSGGQKQRLAIARALVGWPKLLVLDEPTSALDGYSEVVVRQTLSELRGQMTIVVISHRFATVEDCDYILVLEHGRISDFGPRDTVVKGLAFQTVASGELRQ